MISAWFFASSEVAVSAAKTKFGAIVEPATTVVAIVNPFFANNERFNRFSKRRLSLRIVISCLPTNIVSLF